MTAVAQFERYAIIKKRRAHALIYLYIQLYKIKVLYKKGDKKAGDKSIERVAMRMPLLNGVFSEVCFEVFFLIYIGK